MKRDQDLLEEQFKKFPRHELSGKDQQDIHDALMKTKMSHEAPRQNKQRHTKWYAGLAGVAALVIVIVLGMNLFSNKFDFSAGSNDKADSDMEYSVSDDADSGSEQAKESHENTDANVEDDVDSEQDNSETTEGLEIKPLSDELILALNRRDMETVAKHVHPDKGLLFSPYVNVANDAVVFTKNDIETMLEQDEVYNWGDYDGSGMPIELTPMDYYDEFLQMAPFVYADEMYLNDLQDRGNTINNIQEKFPDAEYMEYYKEGLEENAGMDWASIILVYERDEAGVLKLVAIVRDMWTI